MSRRSSIFITLFLLVLFMTAACRTGDDNLPTIPTRPAVSEPQVDYTPTQIAIDFNSRPTVTIAPTFTPIPTVTPLPSATPDQSINLLALADFADDRNPLTGEQVDDPANLLRRPITVKISNSPAKYTRPQSGISQADIVFEHVTEGNITRFTAILYGETPEKIGPIRSARLIDLEIPAMYDAALAYSGSSIGVSRKLFSSDFSSRILRSNVQGYYRTGENIPYEHTLYARPRVLWESLEERGENQAPLLSTTLTFTSEPPPGGQPAKVINVEYRNFTKIVWLYDAETNSYLRWADGEPHNDANTEKQISAANVILIFAPHRLDRSICEYQVGSECRAFSTEIQLWGTGHAILFRDGQGYEIQWRRANRHDLLTFIDGNGLQVPLQIGNSWYQIISNDNPNSYSVVD